MREKHKITKLSTKEAKVGYLFLLPAYILYLVCLAIPLVASLGLSFFEVDRIKLDFVFVGLESFEWIFTDPRFWRTFLNTFHFISMSVIGNVGIGLILAIALNRYMPAPIVYILRLAYFLPVLVSLAFVSFIWKFLFSTDLGAINYYLQLIGIEKVHWLTSADVAMFSVIIIDVWKNVGFFVIIFLAALQGIPKSLVEAAAIDGASAWAVTTRITLPHIAPVILFCVTYATIGGLQVFDSIKILTNGGPGDATRSVVMYMVSEAFSAGQLGTAAASALTLLIVITVVVAIQMGAARYFLNQRKVR